MDNKNTKVLLYSGGMDSWLIDKLWKPDVKIFFDTGVDYDIVENTILFSKCFLALFSSLS